ncbi:MAG: CPBP family intramembrane glutamic endopeptidase [Pirellulales bacterium]
MSADANPFESPVTTAPDASIQLELVRPRIWTVFVAYVAAIVAIVGFQVVVGIVYFAVHMVGKPAAGPADVDKLVEQLTVELTTPLAFILLGIPTQLIIGLAAIVPACLSPVPVRQRLGLVRPRLPWWGNLAVMLGTSLPFGIGVAAAYGLATVIPPDPSVERLYRAMTLPIAVPFVLFIALAPGFMEELLFRGYMQRRLLERWSAWPAILVTSLLFAILHITPHAIAVALPVGIWFGVVAWRTGSVWPGILGHAFVNGAWNVWQIGSVLTGREATLEAIAAAGIIAVVSFAASAWLLSRPPARANLADFLDYSAPIRR